MKVSALAWLYRDNSLLPVLIEAVKEIDQLKSQLVEATKLKDAHYEAYQKAREDALGWEANAWQARNEACNLRYEKEYREERKAGKGSEAGRVSDGIDPALGGFVDPALVFKMYTTPEPSASLYKALGAAKLHGEDGGSDSWSRGGRPASQQASGPGVRGAGENRAAEPRRHSICSCGKVSERKPNDDSDTVLPPLSSTRAIKAAADERFRAWQARIAESEQQECRQHHKGPR